MSWKKESDELLLFFALVAFLIGVLLVRDFRFKSGLVASSFYDGFMASRWVLAWHRRR